MSQTQYTCTECEGKFDANDEACGFAGICPLCGKWIELDHPRKSSFPAQQTTKEMVRSEMRYFEVPVGPSDQFLCSDNQCPCPGQERLEPGKTGYIYISKEVVKQRSRMPTHKEFIQSMKMMQEQMGIGIVIVLPGAGKPIFICELAARRLGLDLAVAASDAAHWAKTGLCPLRATPKATS